MIYLPKDSIADTLALLKAELLQHSATVTLVAVSKQQPAAKIMQALDAGQRVFAENRVQEAKEKWPALRSVFPDSELHLIGPLQTNKIREALAIFDVIETVDRPKLAVALAAMMQKEGKFPACYIQVNTGNEPQKSGIPREEADQFIHYCKEELQLPVSGLMCIPPVGEDPAVHFQLLKTLAERHALASLSMGMSDDYPVALRMGATHIRLGRAIFGERA